MGSDTPFGLGNESICTTCGRHPIAKLRLGRWGKLMVASPKFGVLTALVILTLGHVWSRAVDLQSSARRLSPNVAVQHHNLHHVIGKPRITYRQSVGAYFSAGYSKFVHVSEYLVSATGPAFALFDRLTFSLRYCHWISNFIRHHTYPAIKT